MVPMNISSLISSFYNQVIKIAKKHEYTGKHDTDKTTIYEYSEKHIEKRTKQKAQHVEKLRNDISKLRKEYKKDLNSDDKDTFQVALAVALIDETCERIGNAESAGTGHFGVTGWKKKHINFSNGKININYVGKSGVKQKKTVEDKTIIKALKKLWKEAENGNSEIFTAGKIAVKINAYLKPFGITAKDIRGFHANDIMVQCLKDARKGKLPSDEKEKAKKLKEEFNEALEETAKLVGHESATLRRQYLVPGLVDNFLEDGTIAKKFS